MTVKIWIGGAFPFPGRFLERARWVEDAGADGIAVTDTQNLAGDPYSALCLVAHATSHIQLGTGVTNTITRHAAVTASAITTVQVESGGRAVLGIGRGDSSLVYLGQKPASLAQFRGYLQQVQGYLRGEEVTLSGYPSRMEWVRHTGLPKVPVDVAASGPKVIEIGAQLADRVTLNVGAQAERVRWGIETAHQARIRAGLDPAALSLGAYVHIVVHPSRERARELARGLTSTFARFSGGSMETLAPESRSIIAQVRKQYDMSFHGQSGAKHASALTNDFIDSFAIAGPSSYCIERLQELVALGLDRLVIVPPQTDLTEMLQIMQSLFQEVIPTLR